MINLPETGFPTELRACCSVSAYLYSVFPPSVDAAHNHEARSIGAAAPCFFPSGAALQHTL